MMVVKDFLLKNLFLEMVKFCTDKKIRSVFLIRLVLFSFVLATVLFGVFVDFSTVFQLSQASAIGHTFLTLSCFAIIEFITMMVNTVFRHYKYKKEPDYKFKLCENGHVNLYLDLLASICLKIIMKYFKDCIFVVEEEKAKSVFSSIHKDNRLSFELHGPDSKPHHFWFFRKFLKEVEDEIGVNIFFSMKNYHIIILSKDDERVMAKLMVK